MTSLKQINLNEPVKQVYELYHSGDYLFFPSYKKDTFFSGKPLEEIQNFLLRKQNPDNAADCYSKLEKITEKNGALIYKFRGISGHKSIAMEENIPSEFHFYKIVPKLKLQ